MHFFLIRSLLLSLTLILTCHAGEKSGHLFILTGQSNMTGQLKKGFLDTVTKSLGKENVTVVHCARSGRGIRFWVKDYKLPKGHPFHGKLKAGNGEEFPRLVKAVKDAGETARPADASVHVLHLVDRGKRRAPHAPRSLVLVEEINHHSMSFTSSRRIAMIEHEC